MPPSLADMEEKDLDNLQWAKDFLNHYEKKHKIKKESSHERH